MERVNEMLDSIRETIVQILEKRDAQLETGYQIQKEQAAEAVKNMMSLQTKSIVITWLRSSYITGSHKFRIAAYEEEPFVEEEPEHIYFSLDFFFDFVEDDMHLFLKHLQKQYIHIFKSEIEEMRRYYMEQLYKRCIHFFCNAVDVSGQEGDSGRITVFFGEEMGELVEIGNP